MQGGVSAVTVTPSDYLFFTPATETPAEVCIHNPLPTPVSFRVKTNAPASYNVSPSLGSLESGCEATIRITPKAPVEDSKSRHKFQILVAVEGGPEGQVALLGVKLVRKRDSIGKFVTAVGGEDQGAELDRVRGEGNRVDTENEKLRGEIEDLRVRVVTWEHRKKLGGGRGEGEERGYAAYHVVVMFLFGLLLSRLFT